MNGTREITMRAKTLCFISLACLAWVLVACDLLPRTRSDQLLAEIDEQEDKWLEKDIDSYRIVVSHVRSIWQTQTHEILVSEGRVVEQSASGIPAPVESGECQVESFDPEECTVAGLSTVARLWLSATKETGPRSSSTPPMDIRSVSPTIILTLSMRTRTGG